MDQVTSFDWARIFVGEQPLFFLAELFLRVVVIYIMALLLLRLAGKRSRQQLTTLELLLVIALGSAVGDVMFYPSVAIIYTIIVMLTILILQLLIEKLKTKFPRFDKFVDSKPSLIIKNGKFVEDNLKTENLTKAEIYSSLRLEGIRNMGEVEYAYLEIPGKISVFKFEKGHELDGYVLVPYQEE
ncbi:DUF421 domain-containing protein [Gelidibacter salicanalis]|uniref:DUF421 domain-containing protein n=1 Tax=Gelidibacter salicanalis TaxID=291193 RepID=A0A934KSL1_9FLAO|nr:YetF domain-containing protein [Gelidibacter salicanalis]MBJ7882819.1 DUF421 domain-containing protein [Gelidibacter salicanalis]